MPPGDFDELWRARIVEFAREIVENRHYGEGVDKWKARAKVLARAVVRLTDLPERSTT